MRGGLVAAAALVSVAALAARAQDLPSSRELADLSLEQLVALQITSVSKRPERLSDAPASVFVITADDIRRSGATTVPEALRLAPNLQVAQVSASGYAVWARGTYLDAANKLLVLVDGRSVYSPLFSGVFWDVQDVMLEDIDRIEVVSGPGGTLWGVNAVNGVINIITKSAQATQGGLASADAGNAGSDAAVRYGGALSHGGALRLYAKYGERGDTSNAAGQSIPDGWHKTQAGFRADWNAEGTHAVLEGNAYRGLIGQPPPGAISISGVDLDLAPIPVRGANLLGRWSGTLAGGSKAMVQAYYDRTERTVQPTFAEKLDIFDLQLQHTLTSSSLYSLVWGAELRRSRDRVASHDIFAFIPANVSQGWDSLFAQGDVQLARDLRFIVGARAERNDYTGWEFLPNARLAWKIAPDRLAWLAASRVVRAPSRLDRDAFVPAQPPFLLAGGPEVRSEVAKVYELGYRGTVADRLTYSMTLYHADYERMHTQEIAPSRTFVTFSDLMHGKTDGLEAWATWNVTDRWRLSPGYTVQRERFGLDAGSNDATAVATAGRDPAHAWLLRSSTTLPRRVQLDLTLRSMGALSDPDVPAYTALDARVGWRPTRNLELYLAGRNLADGGHGEVTEIATRTELERAFFAGVRWDFDAR